MTTRQDPNSPFLTVPPDMRPGVSMVVAPWFDELLRKYNRLAIAGGPHVGKTTLARLVTDRPVVHTDDLMHLDWDTVPPAIIVACATHERFVVEGVQVPRALRKGLTVDAVVWLDRPHTPLSKGQAAMSKGVLNVFCQWRALNPRAVVVFR